jgi:hypothetical protein
MGFLPRPKDVCDPWRDRGFQGQHHSIFDFGSFDLSRKDLDFRLEKQFKGICHFFNLNGDD